MIFFFLARAVQVVIFQSFRRPFRVQVEINLRTFWVLYALKTISVVEGIYVYIYMYMRIILIFMYLYVVLY